MPLPRVSHCRGPPFGESGPPFPGMSGVLLLKSPISKKGHRSNIKLTKFFNSFHGNFQKKAIVNLGILNTL